MRVRGAIADLEVQAEETMKTVQRMIEIMALHTGQSYDRVKSDTERDRYLTAEGQRS